METVVVVFLLVTGSLCIVAQGFISVFQARVAAAEAATKSSSSGRASSAKSSSTTRKSTTKKGDEEVEDASAANKVMGSVSRALGASSMDSARVGLIGVALMLVAVTLVLDISFTVGVSTP